MKLKQSLLATALLAGLVPALQGCFPVVATGVAVGVLAVTDRRTVGMQAEDETIEWKVSNRSGEKFGSNVHLNVTSFNRKVLLTGEVPNEDIKAQIGEIARQVDNVTGIYNELQVGPASSLTARSNDAYVTSKVKTRFIDANRFAPNHVKVVTEAGVVHLLGIVNEGEAQAAIQVARTTSGVKKVVNLMDVVAESETRRLDVAGNKAATTAPRSSAP